MQWKSTPIKFLLSQTRVCPEFERKDFRRKFVGEMIARTIYQNLDTAFVDVGALVRFLRQRKFLGAVRVKLNGYEAEVLFGKSEQIVTRERAGASTRQSAGEDGLQKLLVRARASRGTIDVFQFAPPAEGEEPTQNKTSEARKVKAALHRVNLKETPSVSDSHRKLFPRVEPTEAAELPPEQIVSADGRPLRLRNAEISSQDWEILIRLSCEMLAVINKSFSRAGLEFIPVFYDIRSEIALDFPFMDPKKSVIFFDGNRLRLTQKVNPLLLIASLNEIVRRLSSRLASNPKTADFTREIVSKLTQLKERRSYQYERFGFLPNINIRHGQ